MPAGIQLFRDGEAEPYFGEGRSSGFFLGSATLTSGNNTGSQSVPEFADGIPFYWLDGAPQQKFPTVVLGATSISWTPHEDGAFFVGELRWGIM